MTGESGGSSSTGCVKRVFVFLAAFCWGHSFVTCVSNDKITAVRAEAHKPSRAHDGTTTSGQLRALGEQLLAIFNSFPEAREARDSRRHTASANVSHTPDNVDFASTPYATFGSDAHVQCFAR